MTGDRPSKEGRDEPEYPKSRINSQVSPSPLEVHWMGWRDCPQSINHRPQVVLDTQIWLPTRYGDGRSHFQAKALCLIPEESARQRLWEWLGKRTDSEQQSEWNYMDQAGLLPFQFLHDVNSPLLNVALGDFWFKRSPL